jgi:hypothetical protein
MRRYACARFETGEVVIRLEGQCLFEVGNRFLEVAV